MEGLSDNGVMTVRAGDTLTLRYEDPMPPGERTATAAVARQGVLQASPAAVVSAGGAVLVTILDPDLKTQGFGKIVLERCCVRVAWGARP